MMDVIPVKHRHQHRCIEKSLHSPLATFAMSRSLSDLLLPAIIGGGSGHGLPTVEIPRRRGL